MLVNGIMNGGSSNGMLDRNLNRYLCFDGMMAMLGRHPTIKKYNLVSNSIPLLLKIHLKKGQIPEDEFDKLGFLKDANDDGNI